METRLQTSEWKHSAERRPPAAAVKCCMFTEFDKHLRSLSTFVRGDLNTLRETSWTHMEIREFVLFEVWRFEVLIHRSTQPDFGGAA